MDLWSLHHCRLHPSPSGKHLMLSSLIMSEWSDFFHSRMWSGVSTIRDPPVLGVIIGLLTGNSVHRASSDTFEGSSKRVGTSEGLGFAFNLPKSWESSRAEGCSIEQAMGLLPYLLDFSPGIPRNSISWDGQRIDFLLFIMNPRFSRRYIESWTCSVSICSSTVCHPCRLPARCRGVWASPQMASGSL